MQKKIVARVLSACLTLALILTLIPAVFADSDPSISLDKSTITFSTIGTSYTLAVTASPTTATLGSVTWSSDDDTVATVSSAGLVTAVADGTATVTAAATLTVDSVDKAVSATCTVKVETASTATLALDKTSLALTVGGTGTLTATPSAVSWTSDTTSVATVDTSGKVTAIAAGTATITAKLTADDSVTASCTVKVTAASTSTTIDQISYSVAAGEDVTFKASTFNTAFKNVSGTTLSYIIFTSLPSSTRGVLYYNYDDGTYDSKVSTSTKYYYSPSSSQKDISLVTFEAESDYSGSATVSYTAYDADGASYTGTIKITIDDDGSDSDSLTYTIDDDEVLDFSVTDFNTFCKSETGSNLDYVTFTLPSSSKGVLYYDYDDGDYDGKVTASTKYYRSSSPYVSYITFVPKSGYSGTVSISFSGKSTGSDSFSGTVKITVGADAGEISYTAAVDEPVTMVLSDFTSYCKDETSGTLSYVKFTLPSSSKGVLYYNYDEDDGTYDSKVSASTKYYRTSKPYLEYVTFVPKSGLTGTVSISFSGATTGDVSFSGTLTIDYASAGSPTVISYSSSELPITFNQSNFTTACAARGASALSTVTFTSLPASSAGKLYYGYESPTSYGGLVSTSTAYDTGSGTTSLSNITFVPKAGYTGSFTLTYTGTDTAKTTYTGSVTITVSSATTSKTFQDIGSYTWAAGAIDFIYTYGVTTGASATTYNPGGNITRGDFVLMLYRAFGFKGNAAEPFSDVSSSDYYYTAIQAAKALGIAQGDNGSFRPKDALTREDAMVLIQRTLEQCGYSISSASESYLNSSPDGSTVASYAKAAVATLCQAGIVKGDANGNIMPKNSMTRAEMAVILHRVLTL